MNKIHKRRMVCMSLMLILFLGMLTSGIAQITTPEAYLGYKPGADFHLMTYEEAIGFLLNDPRLDTMQLLKETHQEKDEPSGREFVLLKEQEAITSTPKISEEEYEKWKEEGGKDEEGG